MAEERVDIDEATALVRWLLERGVGGLGLTKTHALRRAIVREAAERRPQWWRHELFAPQREAGLRVLEPTHVGLRRMRLVPRQRETLLTTARGRRLLAEPEALLMALHGDLGGEGFEGVAWLLIEEVLHEHGSLESDRLTETVGRLLIVEGWRDAAGAPPTLELTAAGHRLAASEPAAATTIPAAAGDAALVFDAELLDVRGVRARLAVLERQPLTALHDGIQQAFGWWDDHLYSFWLDGSFFGSDDVELTSPLTPDEGVATADVPIAELDLRLGQRIGYVFDFGDEWRVRLQLRERIAAEPGDHPRVLELHGTPPPQYAALDD